MGNTFVGGARALSPAGFASVCDRLSVKAAEVWAVIAAETSGCGYLGQRSPQILFERHKFHALTDGVFDAVRPDLSSPAAGGYAGGVGEYARLNAAMALRGGGMAAAEVEDAALMATSWGLGQIMGMNHARVGYPDVRAMVADMLASEDAQLAAFAEFLRSGGLDSALRAHDWARFARGYNGPDFARNSYDQRMAGQHARYVVGPLPDLAVRAAQLYLTYLGYGPRGIDGILGRFTVAALDRFREERGLPRTGTVDADTLRRIEDAVEEAGAVEAETAAA